MMFIFCGLSYGIPMVAVDTVNGSTNITRIPKLRRNSAFERLR